MVWQGQADCVKIGAYHKMKLNHLRLKQVSATVRDAFLCTFMLVSYRPPRVNLEMPELATAVHLCSVNINPTWNQGSREWVMTVELIAGTIKLGKLQQVEKEDELLKQPKTLQITLTDGSIWTAFVLRCLFFFGSVLRAISLSPRASANTSKRARCLCLWTAALLFSTVAVVHRLRGHCFRMFRNSSATLILEGSHDR